jgi:hypothetical protein
MVITPWNFSSLGEGVRAIIRVKNQGKRENE